MKIPKRLAPLIEEGLVDEVVRPITAGKEAEVFVVWSHGALRAAKVYKEATHRSFKNRSDYLDGRALRGSRGERARSRGGRFGKEQEEEAWQTAELSALGKLSAAGVRVPTPRAFFEGVLIMDLVLAADGSPAPRLADCSFSMGEARDLFESVVHEVQRMLCAGVVHGDLSEYNVLLSAYGPVVIDLPQMIDAAASSMARRLLIRDVGNIRAFAGRFAPELLRTRYAEEMWALWERAQLTPDTALTGRWFEPNRPVDTRGVERAIADANADRAREVARAGRPPQGGGPGRGPRPPRPSVDPRLQEGGRAPWAADAEAEARAARDDSRPQGGGPRPPHGGGGGSRPPHGGGGGGPRPDHGGGGGPRPNHGGGGGPRPPQGGGGGGPRPPQGGGGGGPRSPHGGGGGGGGPRPPQGGGGGGGPPGPRGPRGPR